MPDDGSVDDAGQRRAKLWECSRTTNDLARDAFARQIAATQTQPQTDVMEGARLAAVEVDRALIPAVRSLFAPMLPTVLAAGGCGAGLPDVLGPDVRIAEPSELQEHAVPAWAVRRHQCRVTVRRYASGPVRATARDAPRRSRSLACTGRTGSRGQPPEYLFGAH